MSLDLQALRDAVARHGRVARVVVAEARGSAPRESGAAMLVWQDGQSGTIGGGRLELEATEAARAGLATAAGWKRSVPLGPGLGQCCGGAVTLVTEIFDADAVNRLAETEHAGCVLRPVGVPQAAPPLAVTRHLASVRNGAGAAGSMLIGDWLVEPLATPAQTLWLYGAGHVGRAIIDVLAPLDGWRITWVDTHEERFPALLPPKVTKLIALNPALAAGHAPADAHHLVLTYSHALDLEICHTLLEHGFASAGLIGSATKWTRFRKRLGQLGHSELSIDRIRCPIGDPALGKAPQAIAIGVAAELLSRKPAAAETAMDRRA